MIDFSGGRNDADAVLAGRSPKAPGPACTTNAEALTPVLCLPADFREDQAADVVIGGSVVFDAQLVNTRRLGAHRR